MTPKEVVENYWRIECTRDVDAILGCYHAQAELVVPQLGRLVGHGEIRRFYQASIDRFPVLMVDIASALESGQQGAFEWRALFKDHDGTSYRLKGINVIRIEGDRLREVHVYYDPAEIDRPEE